MRTAARYRSSRVLCVYLFRLKSDRSPQAPSRGAAVAAVRQALRCLIDCKSDAATMDQCQSQSRLERDFYGLPGALPMCSHAQQHEQLRNDSALRRLVGVCDDSSRLERARVGEMSWELAAVKALGMPSRQSALLAAEAVDRHRAPHRDRILTGLLAPQPGRHKRFGTQPCAPVHVQPPRRCNFTARAKGR